MPDSGDVSKVDSSPRAEIDSQVRVYGVPPGNGEQPPELVSGFLEAITSDEPDFDTAKQYLADEAQGAWDPFASITVLAQAPKVSVDPTAGKDGNGITILLTGTQLATVDDRHAYEPRERKYEERIHLAKTGGEWRIDSLPPGLVMGQPDFQRIYRSVNKYYFAELGPDAGASPVVGEDVLVADPVYLRKRVDSVTATVNALLDGPTNWLDPVVSTAFPTGTTLAAGEKKLTLDDSHTLSVRLNDRAARIDEVRCHRMAAQVFFTVQDQTSTELSSVRLERANGSELCSLSSESSRGYAPDRLNGRMDRKYRQYFVDDKHRVVSLSDEEDVASPVAGAFGLEGAQLGSVAIARDERFAAGVSRDGRLLYTSVLEPGAQRGVARLTSRAADPDNGLTTPSWDALGGLWVADRDPRHPRLLRLQNGTGTPEEVRVPGLGGGRITSLRISSDGMRLALLVERDGHTTLQLGRVERRGTAKAPELSVEGLRSIGLKLEDVDAAAWAGDSRLVVAGHESRGVQKLLMYVETDGSPADIRTIPAPGGIQTLAATEGQNRPLLAGAKEDGIVRLTTNGDWESVAKAGVGPVYPG
ncbi:hypothetical protein CD790_28270 [Streptomyces sp. SAJ15]|nr:hypothetical protein CD790_28270 [Streptomyces sp. SAJ15]